MRRQRGSVLVVVLIVLVGMVAALASFVASQRLAFQAERNRIETRHAELSAQDGIERALAELALLNESATPGGPVTLLDNWAVLGERGDERFSLGPDGFRLEIVDASGLININTAPREMLERLPLTSEQIDSLLDWREGDPNPRPEGAKNPYYDNLPQPYNAKLRTFETIEELLLVKGFLPRTLYEPIEDTVSPIQVPGSTEVQPIIADLITTVSLSPNLAPDGQTKLNANQVQQAQLIQRGFSIQFATGLVQRRNVVGQFTRLGELFTIPGVNQQVVGLILDQLTISPEPQVPGRINVNTASESVLNALPGMTPDVASAIVSRQNTGFNALSELLDVPGFTQEVAEQCADLLTVSSSTFLVRVIGERNRVRIPLVATVQVTDNEVRVTQVTRPPFRDMTQRWLWPDEASRQTILLEGA
ncbi:MAG: general secretion pathway protein GspK [Fimbriimonadaceae bacterium]